MTPKERVIAALEHREPDMDYSPLFSFPFAPFFSSLLPFFPVRQFGYGAQFSGRGRRPETAIIASRAAARGLPL